MGSGGLERPDFLKDLGSMPLDADFAPLGGQISRRIDQESTALYALHLLAVHVLQLDDVELTAQRFICIGEELKREFLLALEVLMGLEAVAGDTKNFGAEALKIRIEIAKILPFLGAAGGAVLRLEIKNQVMSVEP
jgi:hypothetical protein